MRTPAISIVMGGRGADARLAAMLERQTLKSWERVEEGGEANSPVLVFLGPEAELAPATLEVWAWTLASFPDADYVGAGCEGTFAIRGAAWARCDGFDAAAPDFERFGLRAAPSEGADRHGEANVTPQLEAPIVNARGGGGGRSVLVLLPYLELGGAEKLALELMGQLGGRHGYRFTVAATLPGEHRWRAEFERLTPDCFTLASFLQLPDYPRFLAYLVESRTIEAVLINNSQFGYQALPFLRARFPRLACYDFVHSETEYWKSGGYARYSIHYQHFLRATMVASGHLKGWMAERGGRASRIEVCHAGIDCGFWRRTVEDERGARARYGIGAEEVVITFAGRLCEQKQPGVLGEALLGLARGGRGFTALVAGDGEFMGELRELVARHGLEQVRLLGAVGQDEIRSIYAMTDILFLPSASEGIACVLYEAMAMGAVVVTSDAGGQAELVTAECGVVVKRSTAEAEAEAYVRELEALVDDRPRRRRLGAAARRRVEADFPIERMADKVAEVLLSGVDGGGDAFGSSEAMFAAELVESTRLERVAGELWRRLNPGG